MNTIYKFIYLLIFILFLNISFAIDEAKFITLVLNKHKLFLSDEIDLYIKQENLKAKYSAYYDWHFNMTAKYGYEKLNAQKDNVKSSTYVNNQVENLKSISFAMIKEFPKGMTFNTKLSRMIYANEYDKYRNLEHYKNSTFENTEYKNTLEIFINIPLLKNNNGGTNKLYYGNAKFDKTIEEWRLLEDKEDIVAEKLTNFIELAINRDKIKVITSYLASAKNLGS